MKGFGAVCLAAALWAALTLSSCAPQGESSAAGETPPLSAAVGDHVRFGTWEQNGDVSDGPESIEWIVLGRDGDRALLLSRYGLAPGRELGKKWDVSPDRQWLNGGFFSQAFTPEEQSLIPETLIPAEEYRGRRFGEDTADRVFLLSREELEQYLPVFEDRVCPATKSFAEETRLTGPDCLWLLRSLEYSGFDYASPLMVGVSGRTVPLWIRTDARLIFALRPALWADVSAAASGPGEGPLS